MKNRFHLTITDNKTGEKNVDIDTSVIFGSYVNGEQIARIEAIEDTARVVGRVLYSLEKLLHEGKESHPAAMLAYMMYKLTEEDIEEEETVKC